MLENLHRAAREAAHRHVRRALHEKHNVIGFDFIVDLAVNVGHLNFFLKNLV